MGSCCDCALTAGIARLIRFPVDQFGSFFPLHLWERVLSDRKDREAGGGAFAE
ncbi:hypothetical protein BV133_1605 [Blastochloris viridis]|uniref:Uncharacterized protein n=1 Tax=Blastochloris viridis TaxID=1079 RepID=A0A182D1G3_BLAVI|nr:hypothetical protein BV133_1605 [Blastochloris viridis]